VAISIEDVLKEEAREIHGTTPQGTGKELNRGLNALNSAALCLSGGGIRSAAFALGVIQALASFPRSATGLRPDRPEASLLSKFHYLSTVSGGGFIGSWLSTWTKRLGFADVWAALADVRDRPENEPAQISWLRRYGNYLTPKLGALSADTWTAIALSVRNLLLNWLVILPVICAALIFLKAVTVGVAWIGKYPPNACSPGPVLWPVGLGLVCLLVSLRFTTRHRPSRRRPSPPARDERVTQGQFLWGCLAPAVFAGVFFTVALAVPCTYQSMFALPLLASRWDSLLFLGPAVGAAIYGLTWIIAWPTWSDATDLRRDFVAWLVAGAVYGSLLAVAIDIHRLVYGHGFWEFDTSEIVLLVFGIPWVLTAQLIAEMIFVGLSSSEQDSDLDREWLGRAAGWCMVIALGWIIVMFFALVAAQAVTHLYTQYEEQVHGLFLKIVTGASGLLSGAATAILGGSSRSPAQRGSETWKGLLLNVALVVSAFIFALFLVVGTSAALDGILIGGPLLETKDIHGPVSAGGLPPWPRTATQLLVGLALVLLIGAIASASVNINRFSLHALYRNRLVRAFLGASNPDRDATKDPFTDFTVADNAPMSELWPARPGSPWQPFHVVNISLNIVSTKNLAWQERKAESFTVSPLHAGSACKAFRPSAEYGGNITIGTAVAVSGAAASPNMGYYSSPGVTFLMAMLNVRLGWWLGNPGEEGERTYRRDGPRFAIKPLLEETFGLTTDAKPYVYLSDGGHFENLGLYEMVRRRCRFIVVSDAAGDPDFAFASLGNAVRKIRLDLGVTIRFRGLANLKKRPDDGSDIGPNAPYHAIGDIDYPAADNGGQPGLILYIKPGYHGTEGAAIRSYAVANPDFPHQSTANQWFGESQFESYRALGYEIMSGILWCANESLGFPADGALDAMLNEISKTVPQEA